MAYTLKIKRDGENEIMLEEWLAAVGATEGLRSSMGEQHTAISPQSGAILCMPFELGDVDIYDPATDQWHFAVRFYDGSPTFNARIVARALGGDLSDPAWQALWSVGSKLGAAIVGEEGEVYGPDGKVV